MEEVNELYRIFKHRLANLSTRNRSLLLLRLQQRKEIDLKSLEFLLQDSAEDLWRKILSGTASLPLCKELDARDAHSNQSARSLKYIRRNVRKLEEECGERSVFLAYPFVEGAFANETPVRAPLLYFPLDLVLEQGQFKLKKRCGEQPHFNLSFLLAYSQHNQIPLPQALLDLDMPYAQDIQEWHLHLYALLKEHLEVNFNRDLLTQRLKDFRDFRKEDFHYHVSTGQLKLMPYAVLGLFPQADNYLMPDYDVMMEKAMPFPLSAEHLHQEPKTWDENKTYLPFELDGSQEQAIAALKAGRSLVVQGPPGTGKSQLIANAISDAVANGKKVLFVCQKRVALDVVFQRLGELGISDFCALIHDYQSDRAALYQAIAQHIEQLEDYQKSMHSLNAIHLERRYQQTGRLIEGIEQRWAEIRQAFYAKEPAGISVKELYLLANPNLARVDLPSNCRSIPYQDLEEWMACFRRWQRALGALKGGGRSFALHPLRWAMDLTAWQAKAQGIKEKTKQVQTTLQELENRFALQLDRSQEHMEELQSFDSDWQTFQEARSLFEKKWACAFVDYLKQEKSLGKFWQATESLNDWPAGLDEDEADQVLGFTQSNRSWLRLPLIRPMILCTSRGRMLKELMQAYSLPWQEIERKVLEWRSASAAWQKPPAVALSLQEGPVEERQRKLQRFLEEAETLSVQLGQLENKGVLTREALVDTEFCSGFNSALQEIAQGLSYLKPYFTDSRKILDGAFLEEVQAVPSEDIEAFGRLEELKKQYPLVFTEVLEHLAAQPEVWEKLDEEKLRNSFYFFWIARIEKLHPQLKLFSSSELLHMNEDLEKAYEERRSISRQLPLLRLREQALDSIEYNRLGNRTTYRKLHHQVSKQRQVWPIRKLFQTFKEELLQLLPCWMASPETASAVFSMEEHFDLVLFDEASQCFSEKALPAMLRGKQLMVAGDAQQLRPHHFFQQRYEQEELHSYQQEKESLLDLASEYLPSYALREHYRSEHPALIAFSNRHFYEGRLEQVPLFDTHQTLDSSIQHHLVQGVWDKGSNAVEALKLLERLRYYTQHHPQWSIGIITFNQRQQDHILDLLDQAYYEGQLSYREGLFVKNIENVQGDERDVILFSLGYARDASGRFRMNFGPLNQQGGENRLNVAITRSRQRMEVVSSVLPSDFRLDNLRYPGPRLLRDFLAFAVQVSEQGFSFEMNEQNPSQHLALAQKYPEKKVLHFVDLAETDWRQNGQIYLCDGERFRLSPSAKDWFIYKKQRYLNRGWTLDYLYSRNYAFGQEEG